MHSMGDKARARAILASVLSSSPRVLMVLQVLRGWQVKGALLVYLDSVVREDSLAFPAHR